MRVLAVIILGLLTAACDREQQDITGSTTGECQAKLYSAYNPKDLNQCVNACKSCDRGTTVTCTTSCTLHGAR